MARSDFATTSRLRYLGFAAFAFLVWYVGPQKLLQALAGSNLSYIIAALVLNLTLIAVKTWRWQVLLLGVGIRLPFVAAYRACAAGIFLGCLTPGRLGEFVKAAYVSQNLQVKLGKTLPPVLIDRIFDFYLLLILGLIALFHYSMAPGSGSLWALGLLVLAMFALPILLSTRSLGNWLQRSPAMGKLRESWRETILEMNSQLRRLNFDVLARGFGFTLLAYLIFFFQCQLAAWSAGVEIPFVDLVLVMSMTNLLSLLPVSFSGIGVRDATLIILLAGFGIGQAQAVALSLAILVIFYGGGILLGSLCWIWEPVKLTTAKSAEIPETHKEK